MTVEDDEKSMVWTMIVAGCMGNPNLDVDDAITRANHVLKIYEQKFGGASGSDDDRQT